MSNIDHIVLDIGQVLIFWDPEIPFKRLIPDEEKRSWFLSNVCNSDWNLEQDRGRDWREAEDLLIGQFPKEETLIRSYRKHWIDMIPSAIEQSVSIMLALIDSGHDVTLLTNFNQETFPLAKRKFPFLNLARGETVSGEIGLIKPDQEIYNFHVKKHNLNPTRILFFDDNQSNVDAARAAGWKSERFASPERMAKDLTKYGVV